MRVARSALEGGVGPRIQTEGLDPWGGDILPAACGDQWGLNVPSVSKTFEASGTRVESFRVPVDCAVDLRVSPDDDWRRTSAANISMSGMFVRSTRMYPRGTGLDVKFELQNGQPAILAKVEVLWSRVRDLGPEAPQGLGVRFLNLDLESKYAISRLVDRYQQLGRMPFQLLAEDEKPAAHASRNRHGVLALALAFLAGAAAGAAGSFWLIARSDPGLETADVAQASGLTPKSARRTPAAMAIPEAVAEADPEPASVAPAEDPTAAVVAAVVAWAEAWAAKDIERYLAAYSADFQPAGGRSLDAWQAQRRQRLARPGEVEIGVFDLEVEILAPDRAVARFDQAYAAPGYRDRVRKQLELLKQGQAWRIGREEIQAELAVE